jgi:hypothetical protein
MWIDHPNPRFVGSYSAEQMHAYAAAAVAAERDALLEALRQVREQCDGNNWNGGENVYLSRKWIIKLCNDTLNAARKA